MLYYYLLFTSKKHSQKELKVYDSIRTFSCKSTISYTVIINIVMIMLRTKTLKQPLYIHNSLTLS